MRGLIGEICLRFILLLLKTTRRYGIQMNPHFDTKIISPHQIRQCIYDLHANGGEFGLFVLIGDCPESYQTIKRCALQEFGIITLCKYFCFVSISEQLKILFYRL